MSSAQRWFGALVGWILLVSGGVTLGGQLRERLTRPLVDFDCAAPSEPGAGEIRLHRCDVIGDAWVDMVYVLTDEVDASAYPLGFGDQGDAVALLFASTRPPDSVDGWTVHPKRTPISEVDLPVFVVSELRYDEDYGEQIPPPFSLAMAVVGGLLVGTIRPPLNDSGRFVLCGVGVWAGLGLTVGGVVRTSMEGPWPMLQVAAGLPLLLFCLWRGRALYPVVTGRTPR